jgi:hypothetical protein
MRDTASRRITRYDNNRQVDFSKTFDSVDHDILLQKLQVYGINGSLLRWFESYLNDR